MKRTLLVLAAFAAAALSAAPTISINRVQQRYPWNGLIDIDYTVEGLEGEVSDFCPVFRAAGIVCSNFVAHARCDLPAANGTHRVTWNAPADGVQRRDDALVVSVDLVYAPTVREDATFAIVDLSGGPSAATVDVKYVTMPTNETEQFNKPLYKRDKMVLRRVPAGTFTMGGVAVNNYNPGIHDVQLTEDFFLGVFTLTRRQYRLMTGADAPSYGNFDSADNPVDERPAVGFRWIDFVATGGVVSNLNSRARNHGLAVAGFDLPTEAQWEYACRAGERNVYYWGDTASSVTLDSVGAHCWWNFNIPEGTNVSHAVGRKIPNNWGFHDMAGNVMEACLDWYGPYEDDPAYVAGGVTVDPHGVPSSAQRVYRGCYWSPRDSSWLHVTSVFRYYCEPAVAYSPNGIRFVLHIRD